MSGQPKYQVLFIVFTLLCSGVRAQHVETLRGSVTDDLSGEPLVGATLRDPAGKAGTVTDVDGNFKWTAAFGEGDLIIISYIGYATDTLRYSEDWGGTLDIRLTPGMALTEVVVSDKTRGAGANVQRNQMGYIDLDIKDVSALPALLSENDVLKAIQLLPGIQSSEGATTGFYVRGGSSDQNLILLNNAVIYNPFHAAGFISIFNNDIIDDISIQKSAFPSAYGGRLSSLLKVDTKDPSMTRVTGSAGIGLLTARLTMEVPVVRNKLGISFSGRGFYSYSLYRAFADEEIKKDLPKYFFYDAYAQATWKPRAEDKITLFYYTGQDLLSFQDQSTDDSTRFTIPWSNTAAGGSWQHWFSDRTVATFSAYHSRYDFEFVADYTDGGQSLQTKIREWGSRVQVDHSAGNHYLNIGVESVFRELQPRVTRDVTNTLTATTTRIADATKNYRSVTTTAYINDDWQLTPRIGLNYGLRVPLFVGSNSVYYSVDPKAVLRFQVHENHALKASYSFGSQFTHMLVSSTATTPLDLWVGSSPGIRPQRSHMAAAGWYWNFGDQRFEWSVEGYYKKLLNQIDYKEGADVFSEEALEDKLLRGTGWTTGIEFFLRKKIGKLTGFTGYTLSWADRRFEELNGGRPFDYKYDRRHDMTFSIRYQFTPRWSVSALFVIGSAQALTVPQGTSVAPNANGGISYVYDYEERNSFRLRPYHRLDLSLQYSGRKRRVQSHFKFDIYNVYNQKNSFFVLLDTKGTAANGGSELFLRDYALIPVMPSLSYQIDF